MEGNIVHHIGSFFHPTAPHFFKIILQQTIRTGKLVVPKKFVRKYGKDLSLLNAVILKVPDGDAWEVELRKGASDVWLQKGWLDFANFYSIKHGYFLVFKYEPGSSNVFDVVVFEQSATEIEYPMKSKVTLLSIKVESVSEDDDISAEKWNPQPSSGTKRSWTNTCPWEYKGPLEGEEKRKALERAKSFESSNPYFPVVMQPSYVHRSYKLSVPGRMLQSYLGQHKSGKMKLLVSGDKTWNVTYYISAYGSQVRCKIYNGWKAFVVDNNIVLGDVGVFELMRGLKNVSLKVSIFRAPRVADSRILRSQAKNKQKIARGSEFQPVAFFSERCPSFQMVMTDGVLSHRCLRIPTGFAKEHINLELQKQMATLQIEDRSWPVKLITSGCPCPQVIFSGGFGAFLNDNSMKTGDLCTFELIRKAEIVFRISIRAKKVKD